MALFSADKIPAAVLMASGMVAHVAFKNLEPRRLDAIFSLLFGPPTILVFVFLTYNTNILRAVLCSYALYLGALSFSVVVYRLSPFHPLASFPGPMVCRISRFWAWYIVKTGKQHIYYKALHDRYGTYVRTGPNHLHICEADAVSTVMGANGFPRGPRYSIAKLPGSTGSLFSITDLHEHAQRRRIWDRSLNTNSVHGYMDVLAGRISQLVGALEQRTEVDLSLWLSCFSFDFMGDLAFGGAFKLMEQASDKDGYVQMTGLGARYQEVFGAIPWSKPFLAFLPGKNDLLPLRQFSKESVLARKAEGSRRKDIFYYLLDEEGVGSGPPSLQTLVLEAGLVIIAGSDTTATTLSNLFFYLLSTPEVFARLQAEVDHVFPPGSDVFVPTVVGDMKYLNAVINETLRLQPAVPNGAQRVVPRGGGTHICGRWVAGGTTVQVPTYAVHRDRRYFSPDPDVFLPDRWIDSGQQDYHVDRTAYFPFSYGPMNCAGKSLALLELRMVTCSLIQKFEFELAYGWDTAEWEKNLLDCFVLVKGALPVRVKARI